MPNTDLPSLESELLALSQLVTDLANKINRLNELDTVLRHLVLLRRVPQVPTRLPQAPALPAPQ